MAPRRPKLRVVSTTRTFDKSKLCAEDLWLLNLCERIAELPQIELSRSKLADVQALHKSGDFPAAMVLLSERLGPDYMKLVDAHTSNRRLFRETRKSAKIKSKSLAAAVGVTPSTMCNFEKQGRGLALERLLVAAEIIGLAPAAFLAPRRSERDDS
jgi:DNA-binding XRE family transcriptional regulator